MRRLIRFTALCVGVLLLAAPAAFACGEFSAAMAKCPMTDQMAEMSRPMGTSICHDNGQMSKDCCGVRSAPEPMQARSFESVELLTALEVADLLVAAPIAPAVLPLQCTSADAFRLHDLGRYTLFSSFLL